MSKVLLLGIFFCLCMVLILAKLNGKNTKYSNKWVANIEGGEEVAKKVARDLGYTYKGQFGEFKDYYELIRENHPEVSERSSEHLTKNLLDIEEVKWAKQQIFVKRIPTGSSSVSEKSQQNDLYEYLRKEAEKPLDEGCRTLFSCIRFSSSLEQFLKSLNQGDVSKLGSFSTDPAPKSQLSTYTGPTRNIGLESKKVSAYALEYNDTEWRFQWYMQDYRTTEVPVMDLNVVPVHKMNYTGRGVVVAVIDDGVDPEHPDLKPNLNNELSYDYCDNKAGAKPHGEGPTIKTHGTKCAGVIAMVANNGIGGVGIAFNAKIVGIRAMCDNDEEYTITKALIHGLEKVDIYCYSWGPDSTNDVYVLSEMDIQAYEKGTTEGRGGKGVIYIHSTRKGKDIGDNCAADCDINNPYVISTTAADQFGKPTKYAERCTAIYATTYSSGDQTEGVVTTSSSNSFVKDFGNTSATVSEAAGIIALVLEANPQLTYRDVMHLIAWSSEVAPLANTLEWYKNGRGLWVSNDFGFGLMNAENMVKLAVNWQNVGKRHTCIVTVDLDKPMTLEEGEGVTVPFENSGCKGSDTKEVNYLEQIEVSSIVKFPVRGNINVFIISPSGTESVLLAARNGDYDRDGLEKEWSIMSTHNWGEDPRGTWKIKYKITHNGDPKLKGQVEKFTIKFHGTKEMPANYKKDREYAAFKVRKAYN